MQIQLLRDQITENDIVGSTEEIIQRVGKHFETIWTLKIKESHEKSVQELNRLHHQARDSDSAHRKSTTTTKHQHTQTRVLCQEASTVTNAIETAVSVCQTNKLPTDDTPCSKTKCITQLRRQISVLERLLYAKFDNDGGRCTCSQNETDTSSKSENSSILSKSLLSSTHIAATSAPLETESNKPQNAVNVTFPSWKDRIRIDSSPELSSDSLPSIEAILALTERLETIRPEALKNSEDAKTTSKTRMRSKSSQHVGKSYTSATASSKLRSCTFLKSSNQRQPPTKPKRALFRPHCTPKLS